jgi:nitrate reductase cytochrome c-type subunit
VDYADIVARMMDAHPRKDGLRLAEQQLAEIISSAVNPAAVAAQIEQTHARWSKTDGWTRENGRYCPKLANWLAKAGYLDQPPSAPESVPVYRRPPEERGDY